MIFAAFFYIFPKIHDSIKDGKNMKTPEKKPFVTNA
jgi:hypothetical protein